MRLVELDDVQELGALVKGANVFVVDADEEERLGIDAKWAKKLNSSDETAAEISTKSFNFFQI